MYDFVRYLLERAISNGEYVLFPFLLLFEIKWKILKFFLCLLLFRILSQVFYRLFIYNSIYIFKYINKYKHYK